MHKIIIFNTIKNLKTKMTRNIERKENKVELYSYNHGDIELSHRQYYDMVYPLLDQRLSPHMLMKFKNLYEINSYGMYGLPIAMFPFAYAAARFFVGPIHRGLGHKRAFWTILSITLPVLTYVASGIKLPRKLYTDILTDNGTDGTYIRSTLRDKKPGLWRDVSKQLFKLKFQFPEMNEYRSAIEFPEDFVTEQVL